MRVCLDTNVLVAAFATRGLCADALRHDLSRDELVTSESVLTEPRRNLKRKLGLPDLVVEQIESFLRSHDVQPAPKKLPNLQLRDHDDLIVLASALAGGARVLVTGDKDLLDVGNTVPGLLVTDPRGFWRIIRRRRKQQRAG